MFEVDQQARRRAIVGIVDEHASLLQKRLKAFQHHVHRGIEQRVARRDEYGLRLPDD